MRTNATQSSPVSEADIRITIGADVFTSQDGGRLVSARLNEQVWGGQYTVELDNSDEALNAKDYKGKGVTVYLGFIGVAGSDLAPLWVDSQEFISLEGKLLLRLNCIDAWGLLAEVNAAVGAQYWNNPEQAPKGSYPDPEYYDKTLLTIITTLISQAINKTVVFDATVDDDGIINVQTPALAITNARRGVMQALGVTKCYLLWRTEAGVGKFQVVKPDARATAYSYNVANLFFNETEEAGVTIPNRVIFYGYDNTVYAAWKPSTAYALGAYVIPTSLEGWKKLRRYKCTTAGTSGTAEPTWVKAVGSTVTDGTAVWTCETLVLFGSAEDGTSVGLLGYIDIHFRGNEDEIYLSNSITQLTALAQGKLAKIQGERNQGTLVAPLHCAQELLDKITIVDDRYTTPKTITGYVHRIIREYGRGIYRVTIQLGGVTSGFTSAGGVPPLPPAELEPVPPMIFREWKIPFSIQGYQHNITFTAADQSKVDWTAGTIKFYDGTTMPTNAGTHTLATGVVHYIYFVVDDPVLKVTDNYLGVLTLKTGMLCLIQRGSDSTVKAAVIPSYGKTPLITADVIYLTGLLDKLPDGTYGKVLSTKLSAGSVLLSATVQATDYRTVTDGEKGYWDDKEITVHKGTAAPTDTTKLWLDTTTYIMKRYTGTVWEAFTGKWYEKKGVALDATKGIALYGGQISLRTYPTLTDYQNDTNVQCYVDTNGKIIAGGGKVSLDAAGITINSPALDTATRLVFKYDGVEKAGVYTLSSGVVIRGKPDAQLILDCITLGGVISGFQITPASEAIGFWGGLAAQNARTNTMWDILPYDATAWLGRATARWARVYGVPILDRTGVADEGSFKHLTLATGHVSTYSDGAWRDNA